MIVGELELDPEDAAVKVAVENGLSTYAYARDLDDGRGVWVMLMAFGNGRIAVGPLDGQWLDDVWCYDSVALAVFHAMAWQGEGEPFGWKRHPATGRRRPGGDPEMEYVSR